MNFKKTACALISLVLVICLSISAFPVFAGTVNKDSEENPAWLSDVYVRESSVDFKKNAMVPRSKGVYTRTLGGFRKETDALRKAALMTSDDLTDSYDKVITEIYQIMDKTGVFAEYDVMKEYLQTEHKIVFPEDDSEVNKTYVAVVYACLKYDLLFPIMGIHFAVPEGVTIDRCVVLLVSALMGDSAASDVETIDDYAIMKIKESLIKNGYPVSDDADAEEIYTLYKIMIAEKQGYKIPNHDVANYTQEDMDYLTGAYTAALIKTAYGVSPTPEDALLVMNSEDSDALPALILGLMIESRGESTIEDNTLEDLFNHACALGFFNLDHKFYSDIYEYDVYLEFNCKSVWITPFAFATELGPEKTKYAKITVNGVPVQSATSYRFNLSGKDTKAIIKIDYDDGTVKDTAAYTLYIHNGNKTLPEMPDLPAAPPSYGGKPSNPGGDSSSGSGSNKEYIYKAPDDIDFVPYEIGAGSNLPGLSSGKKPAGSASADDSASGTKKTSSESGTNNKLIIIGAAGAVAVAGAGAAAFFIIRKKRSAIRK